MRRSLFIVLFALYAFYGSAQKQLSYSTKHYTDVNGLPQNSIKSMAKDDAGYLWLATEGGLSRFDGNNFMLFDKPSNARSNRIYRIKRDLKTRALYAQTEYYELIQINKGRVSSKLKHFDQVFPGLNVQIQVQESPVLIPEIQKFCIQLNTNEYYNITADSLFFSSPKQTVARSFKRKTYFNFFISDKQLFHYETGGKFTLIKNGEVKDISIKGDLAKAKGNQPKNMKIYWNAATNQAFCYLDKAIYLINYEGNALNTKLIVGDFDVENQQIKTMYFDTLTSKIFLGSPTQGLFVLQLHHFYPEKQKKDLNSSVKYALHPFNDHTVLFANGDLVQSDGKTTQLPMVSAFSNNFSMAIDKGKNIWTQKDFSIYKLSPKGDKLLQSFEFPDKSSCFYLDTKNHLWIGTLGGVYTIDLNKQDSTPKLVLKLKNVSALTKQGDSLWIGTFSGIFRYNLHKKKMYTIRPMSNMHIRNIIVRGMQGEEVWICTYGNGFYLYDNDRLKKMPTDRNGYLNTAHCILEDANGFFWISTNKGLFQVAVKDLLAYSTGRIPKVYYQYYNKSYGFNINEFNGGCQPCGAILKDGNFVYPSLIGSVIFNPLTFKATLPDKPIYIDRIFRDNESIELGDTINIDQNLARLNIWVSSPYFGHPDNLELEYKLASDVSWAKLNGTSMITFSTLSAGKHELLIRKSSGFGNHSTYKKLTIIVKPYFYQSWWFLGLMILYVLGLIAFFFKRRTKLILHKNERLENLVKKRTEDLEKYIVNLEESQYLLNQQTSFQKKLLGAITHDLKSPLKYLMIMGKKLYQHEAADSVLKDNMRTIYVSANSMYHLTENLLNYSKLFLTEKTSKNDYINLNRLVAEKIEVFAEIARYNGTIITNNIPESITLNTNRVMLTVIVHNLLDNAIKFCPNGYVNFGAQNTREDVSFWVQDTGCGLPVNILNWLNAENGKDITDGLGLKMVKEFATKMNLQLQAESKTDEGTVIKLILKSSDYTS